MGNTVSRHLKVLHDADMVECSRRGNYVPYVLADREVSRLAVIRVAVLGSRPAGFGPSVGRGGTAGTSQLTRFADEVTPHITVATSSPSDLATVGSVDASA
jgi:DNA-binding transcriptional ArsR family regulator